MAEHDAMTWMDANHVRYAISVRMSLQIKECIAALPENHWKPAGEDADAIREWAEINYVPADGNWSKEFATPRRYLAIRIKPKQGDLLGDGLSVKHFAIVTNRNDPDGGCGLDLIRWQRQKVIDFGAFLVSRRQWHSSETTVLSGLAAIFSDYRL